VPCARKLRGKVLEVAHFGCNEIPGRKGEALKWRWGGRVEIRKITVDRVKKKRHGTLGQASP